MDLIYVFLFKIKKLSDQRNKEIYIWLVRSIICVYLVYKHINIFEREIKLFFNYQFKKILALSYLFNQS